MVTKTYPLEVEEELWSDYKDTVPRSETLDGPIIEFLQQRVQEHSDE